MVTVDAGSSTINTTDASVSTVIDRKFVENMPLNGRSFQDLISLAPGVTNQTPQYTQNQIVGGGGDFVVNGQRAESNYYTVDGVTANIGSGNGVDRWGISGHNRTRNDADVGSCRCPSGVSDRHLNLFGGVWKIAGRTVRGQRGRELVRYTAASMSTSATTSSTQTTGSTITTVSPRRHCAKVTLEERSEDRFPSHAL